MSVAAVAAVAAFFAAPLAWTYLSPAQRRARRIEHGLAPYRHPGGDL